MGHRIGEVGKQEILQQMLRKFYISNRLSNRYFPENCRWVPLKNCEAIKLPKIPCKELSLTTSCLRSSTENDFRTRFLLVIIKRTFLELAWKRSEHLIVSEVPNNKTAKINYHTKPRTKNSAEEATTGNTSVIYRIGHPVMYHQINNGKRLLNNSFVLT